MSVGVTGVSPQAHGLNALFERPKRPTIDVRVVANPFEFRFDDIELRRCLDMENARDIMSIEGRYGSWWCLKQGGAPRDWVKAK